MSTVKEIYLHERGHKAKLYHRDILRVGHPTRRFSVSGVYPNVNLPIDWTKNNTLHFDMYANDSLGDCFEVAIAHADNTFTGNTGTESSFDVNALISQYETASGGDNGLSTDQAINIWEKGIAGNKQAIIYDVLYMIPTDVVAMRAALYFFGNVLFTFSVPDAWLQNFNTGVTWTAPATPDPSQGHAILWNGVDINGNYKFQSWGTWGWITPSGVASVDPAMFVAFSPRWFNAQGIAPNGLTYANLASIWKQFGGAQVPPFMPPAPTPTPTPGPTPVPTPPPPTTGNWALIDFDTHVITASHGIKFEKIKQAPTQVYISTKVIGLPPGVKGVNQ